MRTSILCALFAISVAALPLPDIGLPSSNLPSPAYAVDFSKLGSVSEFSCLKSAGYKTAFIRAYNPSGQGYFDSNSCQNVRNAYNCGVGTEVYMTPQPLSTKHGYQQLDEMITGLTNGGISFRSVWIQVTSPINWSTSPQQNYNFINSIVSRARQSGLIVGIYTNAYDWNQITRNLYTVGSDVMLWYWEVYGPGRSGESPADFNDFRAFGGFTSPTVKQFGQSETVCGFTVNRDVYSTDSNSKMAGMALREATSENLIVGHIGL